MHPAGPADTAMQAQESASVDRCRLADDVMLSLGSRPDDRKSQTDRGFKTRRWLPTGGRTGMIVIPMAALSHSCHVWLGRKTPHPLLKDNGFLPGNGNQEPRLLTI